MQGRVSRLLFSIRHW